MPSLEGTTDQIAANAEGYPAATAMPVVMTRDRDIRQA